MALFKKHGYDDTSFIAGMTEIDLKRIGIKKRTQRNLLENRIKDLPDFLFEAAVPVGNVIIGCWVLYVNETTQKK